MTKKMTKKIIEFLHFIIKETLKKIVEEPSKETKEER